MRVSTDAYTCAYCEEVVFYTAGTPYYRNRRYPIYSDGYTFIVGWDRFVKCPLCSTYQYAEDLVPLKKSIYDYKSIYPDYSEDEYSGRKNPRGVYGPGIGDYCQLVTTPPFPLTSDDELYIRNRIRWLFNRFFHSYDQEGGITYWLMDIKHVIRRIRLPKRCEIGNAFWQTNLERIVELSTGPDINQRLSRADALRNLGNFQQALAELKSIEQVIDKPDADANERMQLKACQQLIHACKRKRRRAFVVREFTSNFITIEY